jgi:hypothetical protein
MDSEGSQSSSGQKNTPKIIAEKWVEGVASTPPWIRVSISIKRCKVRCLGFENEKLTQRVIIQKQK